MHSVLVGFIAFACTFAGALGGMWLRSTMPQHHLKDDARDTIKTGVGLIATMTALVMGLITASAKATYDDVETAVRSTAVDILTLDRLLARYGPETGPIRADLKQLVARRIDAIWPPAGEAPAQVAPQDLMTSAERLIERIGELKPTNASQESVRPRALDAAESLLKVRWMVIAQSSRPIPLPFLVILLLWLTLTFTSFGLFAPANVTVISVLFVCALSIACALMLVLELDSPLDGWLKVPADPMRYTLSHLGQ